MTTFTQLRDILHHLKKVHDRAAECCLHAEHSEEEHLNLLVEYFRQWERRLERCLDSLEADQRKAFLDTWVQFAPTEDVDRALSALCDTQHESPTTVARMCFDLREQVVKLIELLADRLKGPEVRDQLLKLADVERKAARELGMADVKRHNIFSYLL